MWLQRRLSLIWPPCRLEFLLHSGCWNQSYRMAPEALRIWAQFPVCCTLYINSGLCCLALKCILFFLCAVQWRHYMDSRILPINWPLQSLRGCKFILKGSAFKGVLQWFSLVLPEGLGPHKRQILKQWSKLMRQMLNSYTSHNANR